MLQQRSPFLLQGKVSDAQLFNRGRGIAAGFERGPEYGRGGRTQLAVDRADARLAGVYLAPTRL